MSIPTKNIIDLYFFPDVELLVVFVVQDLHNMAKFMT